MPVAIENCEKKDIQKFSECFWLRKGFPVKMTEKGRIFWQMSYEMFFSFRSVHFARKSVGQSGDMVILSVCTHRHGSSFALVGAVLARVAHESYSERVEGARGRERASAVTAPRDSYTSFSGRSVKLRRQVEGQHPHNASAERAPARASERWDRRAPTGDPLLAPPSTVRSNPLHRFSVRPSTARLYSPHLRRPALQHRQRQHQRRHKITTWRKEIPPCGEKTKKRTEKIILRKDAESEKSCDEYERIRWKY